MELLVKSDSTGREYSPKKCVRLVNPKQLCFYMNKGVEILDFYPSNDFKTGEDIMVFIVDRESSQKAYKEWCERLNGTK